MNIFEYGENEIRRNAPIEVYSGDGEKIELKPLPIAQAEEWLETMRAVGLVEQIELPEAERVAGAAMKAVTESPPEEYAEALERVKSANTALVGIQKRYHAELTNSVKKYFELSGKELPAAMTYGQMADAFLQMATVSDPRKAFGGLLKSLGRARAGSEKKG